MFHSTQGYVHAQLGGCRFLPAAIHQTPTTELWVCGSAAASRGGLWGREPQKGSGVVWEAAVRDNCIFPDFSMEPGARHYHQMITKWPENWPAGLIVDVLSTMVRADAVCDGPARGLQDSRLHPKSPESNCHTLPFEGRGPRAGRGRRCSGSHSSPGCATSDSAGLNLVAVKHTWWPFQRAKKNVF